MKKIQFENGTKTSEAKVTIDGVDYPVTPARYNGATPLSSTVMNTMQDNIEDAIDQAGAEIFVGAEEPTTGEKVWFRKGKNLFDINNIFNILYSNGKIVSNITSWGMSEFIEVSGSTKYTMSSTLISGQTVAQLQINEFDKNKNYITSTFKNTTLLEFTTGANTKYLRVGYRVDRQENIMLEQGDYTSYEAYIEPQIFVRNSNGVYEEFTKKSEEVYSTEEQRIGTWIDGKPLYRKTIKFTDNITKEISIEHKINNFGRLINSSGNITFYNSEHALPVIYPSDMAKYGVGIYSSNATEVIVEVGTQIISNGNPSNLIVTLEYTKTTD